MGDFFRSITDMPVPFNMIVLVVLIGSIATAIGTIVKQVRVYASHRQEVELKRDLLERGMSAGEIEQVIRAHSPGNKSNGCL
jgi:hypothetical protein